jgi:hypothetical protein
MKMFFWIREMTEIQKNIVQMNEIVFEAILDGFSFRDYWLSYEWLP